MPGRQRRKPEGNARRELSFKQDSFKGMNVDLPASEIGQGVEYGYNGSLLSNAENVNCRGNYIEGRRGTERFSYTYLPGSGEIYSGPLQHPSTKRWILHRGESIWLADSRMIFWYEATARSATTVPGSRSTIKDFDEDFVVFTKGGIFYVYLKNDEYFLFNAEVPVNRFWNYAPNVDYTQIFTADSSTDRLSITADKFIDTGTRCILSSYGVMPGGLEAGTIYYTINVSKGSTSRFRLAETRDNALANNYIDITNAGTSSHSVKLLNDYKYRYVNTFVRMVKTDGTSAAGLDRNDPNTLIISETGCKRNYGSNTRDFHEVETCFRASQSNPITLDPIGEESVYTDGDDKIYILNTISKIDTGMIFRVRDGRSLGGITELTAGVDYYAVSDDVNSFKVALTLDDALAGNTISITSYKADYIMCHNNYGADDAFTHMGIYRTLNVQGSTDDSFDPVTNEGNNTEVYLWIADVDIDGSDYYDRTTDEELRARLASRDPQVAIMRGFIPMPNGEIGEVAQGWMFTAERDEITANYTSISTTYKRLGGYHSAFQFHKFNQGIRGFGLREDQLVVFCVSQTKPITLTSFIGTGTLDLVQELDHFPEGDNTIGVLDWGSVTEVEGGSIIAKCSDSSVRIWDGTRWSDDFGQEMINTVLERMLIGSVGAFVNGAWFLWYRDNSHRTHNDKCIRYGFTAKAGHGWTFCTGDKWIKPPLYTGASVIQDEKGIKRLVINDAVDGYTYWIETFESFTGSNLERSFADKKMDGGFCDLGNNYSYDELDDNSLNGALETGTVGLGAATETNRRMEFSDCWVALTMSARVLHRTRINTGDFDVSVRNTYVEKDASSDQATTYRSEVKVADFTSATDQSEINNLRQGALVYSNGNVDGTGVHTAGWKFKAGDTSASGTVTLSTRPTKLRVTREDTTLSVYADNDFVTADTNALWATLSGLQASFAGANNDGRSKIGYNAFHVVASTMPLGCLGVDGQGSTTRDSDFRIASTMKFMELTGNEESFNVKQREAHAYFRPVPLTAFHPAFKINWNTYVDSNTSVVETVEDVQYHGDIQNWREVEGHRIQYEITTNLAKWRMVGMDGHYWSEDKKNVQFDPGSTVEADYQADVADDLDFWLARRTYDRDLATGNAMTASGTNPVTIGPDADPQGAVAFGSRSADSGATEILNNGTFDDNSNWLWVNDFQIYSGKLNYFGTTSNNVYILQTTVLMASGSDWIGDQWYELTYDVSSSTGTPPITIAEVSQEQDSFSISDGTDKSYVFRTISSPSNYFQVENISGTYDGSLAFDNFSLKKASSSQLSITGTYTELSDFTVSFWINTATLEDAIITLSGTNAFIAKFDTATQLDINGTDITVDNINDSAWHFIEITRSSNTVTVKQNNSTKGTYTDSTTYGGTGVTVSNPNGSLADVRVYNDNKTSTAMTYYYNNVLGGGDKVLPL